MDADGLNALHWAVLSREVCTDSACTESPTDSSLSLCACVLSVPLFITSSSFGVLEVPYGSTTPHPVVLVLVDERGLFVSYVVHVCVSATAPCVQLTCVTFLLAHRGCSELVGQVDNFGSTPLHLAAYVGFQEAAEMLAKVLYIRN